MFSLEYQDICFFKENEMGPLKTSINLHTRKSLNYAESKFIVAVNPSETWLDPIPYVQNYLDQVKLLNKPQDLKNLVFPRLSGSTAKCTPSEYSKMLKAVLKSLNISNVGMSSHSLRKGGARHRFIYSKSKWSLEKVCYWAGWSDDTDVKNNSIGMKY